MSSAVMFQRQGLLENNIVLRYALADMYAKCGAVSKVRQVLDRLTSYDVLSWSALAASASSLTVSTSAADLKHM